MLRRIYSIKKLNLCTLSFEYNERNNGGISANEKKNYGNLYVLRNIMTHNGDFSFEYKLKIKISLSLVVYELFVSHL